MHWYCKQTGEPRHFIKSKVGRSRATTLADARKHGYVPSVTSVLNIIDKPALTEWRIDQALDSALILPRREGESVLEFKWRAKQDAKEQVSRAADLGTQLHKALAGEPAFGWIEHVQAVMDCLEKYFGHRWWNKEDCFVSDYGYGGSVDLYDLDLVLDYKTKPKILEDKRYAYDQVMQLAAYAVGMKKRVLTDEEIKKLFETTKCFNLFIGIEDKKTLLHSWTAEECYRGWKMFKGALDIWKAKNNFY